MLVIYCLEQYNTARNTSDHATNTPEHSNGRYLPNSSLIVHRGARTVDPSYNSPLLRRASAARAPGTNSFNDVVDHIAALTTTDLDVDSPTAAACQRKEFRRSAKPMYL